MDRSSDPGELSFVDYLRPVWRFRFVVVLVVLVAAAATYAYYDRQTKTYETGTELYVGESDLEKLLNAGGASTTTERSIANQARLVTTPRVAREASRRLGSRYAPEALLSSIVVQPNAASDFLTIGATSSNPQLAARIANAFASAYLEERRRNFVRSAQSALRDAQDRLRSTSEQGEGSRSSPNDERSGLQDQIGRLQGAVISPPSPGTQLSKAAVPASPTKPKPKRNAIFAAALALALAVIASYLLDRSDRRVRRLEDVETLFDLPILATVPHVRRAVPRREHPQSVPAPLREPHRSMRVNLDLARAESGARTLMLTSALPAEGKSTVVRNLALSYREAGSRVAVVEADLRRPVLAAQFGVAEDPGLGDALENGDPPVMQRVPDNGEAGGSIDVAVAGRPRENPTVLLTEKRLGPVMAQLREDYDLVLIDSPPLLAVSDGLPLLTIADGVVLVVRAGTSTHPAAERLSRTLERVPDARILGAVANDVTDQLAYYYSFNGQRAADGAPDDEGSAATTAS